MAQTGPCPEAAPAIILVQPTLGENIGAAARAMMNFGLSDMRLVRPKGDWPNPKAVNTASGAERILEEASLFDSTDAAVADLAHLYATTARRRDMEKPVLTPRALAAEIRQGGASGGRSGILFGREAKGLHNDDVAVSDAIVMIPVSPEHRSLNLAQAVLLIGYEWFLTRPASPSGDVSVGRRGRPATRSELTGFFEHLERELDGCGFLFPPEKRPSMVRNIRNMFTRARLTEREVKSLRGIVAGLSGDRRRPRPGRNAKTGVPPVFDKSPES